MKILVTGSAGFIGSNLSGKLLANGHQVIGVDNLNDYYDVNLKQARLDQLQAFANFSFVKLDMVDRDGMSALFKAEQSFVEKLFSQAENKDSTGAFEGANYQAQGYYRSAMNCMMFTRSDFFCDVCQNGIEDIILLYTDR